MITQIPKVLFLGSLALVGVALAHAGSQDFVKGVDMTARSAATQIALNQLVDNATVATNKGLIIWTNNTPNVSADPKLVRYIWMDTSVNPVSLKTYNTNTATWVASTISAGSVNTAALADGAVSTIKIANSAVDNSKLADDSVTSAKIVDGTIASTDLGANSVINSKISPGVINGTSIGTNVILNSHLTAGIIYASNLASGFQITGSILGPSSIFNTNLTASLIRDTNTTANFINNSNLTASSVRYTNLNSDATTLIPSYVINIDSAGAITRQVHSPSLTDVTVSKGGNGNYVVIFGTAMGSTNYVASAQVICVAGTDRYVQVTTNTTALVSFTTKNPTTGTAADHPIMVTIWGN
jgi:hypothetical protein